MSTTGRLNACLVPIVGADHFVSLPGTHAPAAVQFLARTYRLTRERTHGGWVVYREASNA